MNCCWLLVAAGGCWWLLSVTVVSPNPCNRYFGAYIVIGVVVGILGPSVDALAARLHSTPDRLSSLFLAVGIGFLVGALGGGVVLDRFPARGNGLMCACLLGIGAATVRGGALQQLHRATSRRMCTNHLHNKLHARESRRTHQPEATLSLARVHAHTCTPTAPCWAPCHHLL